MKKILLIAYSFPPLQDPQSLRWYYLSNMLAKKDFQVDILTIKLPSKFSQEKRFNFGKNINIIRTFPGPIEWMAYRTKSQLGTDNIGNVTKRKRKSFRILKSIYWVIRKTLSAMLLGDIRTEWFPFAVRTLKKDIDFSKYDLMITSQEPLVSSLIGLFIKKFNPNLKWIADIGDPLIVPYYFRYWKYLYLRLEKEILKKADKITVTGLFPKKYLLKLYPEISPNKIDIITQGFDISSYYQKISNKDRLYDEFTILYTGTFYRKFRDPSILIDALSELDIDFKLLIVGRNENFLDDFKKLGNKVIFKGFISHFDVLQLQKKADILLHISNKQNIQIPGKIYEYLGSGTPILCITYNKNDESALLIKKVHAGKICMNRKEEIKSTILELYKLWLRGKLKDTFKIDINKINNYSWQANGEKLSLIINNLIKS